MTKLTASELKAINNPDEPLSLDAKRSWIKVPCPSGHENTVQDHDGGSLAECGECGKKFTYGGYVVEVPSGFSVEKIEASEGSK